MAKVLGIGGVFLKCGDPERLYGWYERHLGLRRDSAGCVLFPWRHAADPTKEGMTAWSLFPRETAYFGPGPQAVMVNYIVDDLDGVLQALRKAGAQVDDKQEEHPYGRFGWAIDPEGNRMVLWQPPPA
jgi:predicted enzyme related to lactoylglutathione lyase